jgi:hypothetical protein
MLETQQLDAVYVCIPPFAHGEPELDLIRRGIPFFVEKPVSLGLDVAEEIAAAVSKAKLITGVGYRDTGWTRRPHRNGGGRRTNRAGRWSSRLPISLTSRGS